MPRANRRGPDAVMLNPVSIRDKSLTRYRALADAGQLHAIARLAASLRGVRVLHVNFKRMQERPVLVGFGVTYETPADRLAEIPSIARAVVEAQPLVRFDRAHFKAFGPSSLDFEVVYYVLSPDYNTYMDIQQEINLALCREFEQRRIAFASPTQTLYLHRPAARAAGNGEATDREERRGEASR